MIEKQPRIALLIDADNSPASKIDVILAELAKVGVTNIRRAYGNWKKDGLKGWEAVLHEYAIRPVQQFDYSKGKNATDMGMVIEAMDLLYTDQPEAFGIVSSDADFTPLVMHLKAKGAQVFGFGAKKTPMPFVNACSRFLYLENLVHGGVLATLIDTATFWSVYLRIPEDAGLVNIDLKLNYLQPVENGRLTAEGRSIRSGKTICYAESDVWNARGDLVAHGTSTLMIIPGKGLKMKAHKFLSETAAGP